MITKAVQYVAALRSQRSVQSNIYAYDHLCSEMRLSKSRFLKEKLNEVIKQVYFLNFINYIILFLKVVSKWIRGDDKIDFKPISLSNAMFQIKFFMSSFTCAFIKMHSHVIYGFTDIPTHRTAKLSMHI